MTCINCGSVIGRNSSKYCSVKCQHDYQHKSRYSDWIGGIEYPTTDRLTKSFVEQRDSYKCQCCGISEWCGKAIVLELDHIDGDWTNNALDNVRLVCPNCHSQTDNYKSKNKNGTRSYRVVYPSRY